MLMSEKRFKKMDTIIDPFPIWDTVEEKGYNCTDTLDLLVDLLNKLYEENEQLHHELQQTKEYLQTKIDECKNHKKMKEIVFGVEQAVGYEKALLQFQKGLKRRLND